MEVNKKKVSQKIEMKKMANLVLEKAKKMKLIKPLSTAFDDTSCEKEEHKGKKESFCR